jgi:hypothetical protein
MTAAASLYLPSLSITYLELRSRMKSALGGKKKKKCLDKQTDRLNRTNNITFQTEKAITKEYMMVTSY